MFDMFVGVEKTQQLYRTMSAFFLTVHLHQLGKLIVVYLLAAKYVIVLLL